jgi:feruloyl esterase
MPICYDFHSMRVPLKIGLLSFLLLHPLRAEMTCESIPTIRLRNTTVTNSQPITTGSLDQITGLPPFCRVAGEIRPTTDSQIRFELWLPLKNWNGKFAGVGNVGFAGRIMYPQLSGQLRRGYATASTDTGHSLTVDAPNIDAASFALGHPERLTDFAYRAVHEITVASKALATSFYGTAVKHSYWIGESTGGRQGLMEAQRFPADYDGIIVGAPPINLARYWPAQFDAGRAVGVDADHHLPPSALSLLHEAVIAACDQNDGINDGLIEDPRTCTFDTSALQCGSNQSPGRCLTKGQVEAARRIYAGLKHPATGAQLFPGSERGSEVFWATLIPGSSPHPVSISYLRYLIFEDPAWDWKTFDLGRTADYEAFRRSESRLARLNATEPDLRAFRQLGGKILHWQGWSDERIPPQSSIDYYENVLAFFSRGRDQGATLRDVQDFYRLFMAPGTAHARGIGSGPNTFDMQPALEQWVEHGIPPDTVVATHSANGVVDRSHPLCPYPNIAVYKGTGDAKDASSFACRDR